MNQRVEVRSIIRKDGKTLFLKHASDQEGMLGRFELPGTELKDNEQPEEALRRFIKESLDVEINTAYLSDVFTYNDSVKRTLQRVVIVYVATIAGKGSDIELSPKYRKYSWKKPSEIKQDELEELSYLLLSMYKERPGLSVTFDAVNIQSDTQYETKKEGELIIHSDGGSRGNPGPSAAGYVVKDAKETLVYEGGAYLGITTNNQAEYHAVRLGLEKALALGAKTVDFYIDSMLVVNQLNGQYVIRNRELWPIHERIKELIGKFDKVSFRHVKREFNQQADAMVNKILDTRDRKEKV